MHSSKNILYNPVHWDSQIKFSTNVIYNYRKYYVCAQADSDNIHEGTEFRIDPLLTPIDSKRRPSGSNDTEKVWLLPVYQTDTFGVFKLMFQIL